MSTNIEVRNIVTVSTSSIPVWSIGDFSINDIVNYLGKLYINTTGVNTETTPDTDTTNWQPLEIPAKYLSVTAKNTTGSAISVGKVVYITGSQGSMATIALSDKDMEATSSKTFGLVAKNVANNGTVEIITKGKYKFNGLDTSSFTEGTSLWLGDDGNLLQSPPAEPAHTVFIGYLEIKGPNSTIIVDIQNGYELNELHGVQIASEQDGQLLQYEGSTGLWKNKSLIGQPNGIASLDGAGKVPSTQLPSYVDDIEEYANLASFPVTGESGKLYLALDTNKLYRWSGSVYVSVSEIAGLTNGQVTFGNSTGGLSQSPNLFWDNTNVRLGVGITPAYPIDIYAGSTGGIIQRLQTTNSAGYLTLTAGERTVRFGADSELGPHFGSTTKGGILFPDDNSFLPMIGLVGSNRINNLGNSSYRFKTFFGGSINVNDGAEDNFMAGRLGIGTATPVDLLNVHGSNQFIRINNALTGNTGLKITYGNSDTHGMHLMYNPNNAVVYFDNTYPISGGTVYGDIYFRRNIAGTMTTSMTIKAEKGNVGIGTTTPTAKLSVIGTGATSATTSLVVHNSTGSSNSLVVRDDGNVGIGTATPTATLHLKAGTATVNSAPLKLTAGTNLTTPENGAFEFDGTNLYFTVGGVRKTVTLV